MCSYFVQQIDRDLSGNMQLQFYLWCKRGTGPECICELDVKQKPQGMSNVALRARANKLRHECVRIAWNGNVHIEVLGKCTIKMGKGGFAVRDIEIAYTVTVG